MSRKRSSRSVEAVAITARPIDLILAATLLLGTALALMTPFAYLS